MWQENGVRTRLLNAAIVYRQLNSCGPPSIAVMPPTRAVTRLKHGEYYADIVPDHRGRVRGRTRLWFYVVQRHGSPDILAIGSCGSEQEAVDSATEAIGEYRKGPASAA